MPEQWFIVTPKWANGSPIMGQVKVSTGGYSKTAIVDKSGKAWFKNATREGKPVPIVEGANLNVKVYRIVDIEDPNNIVDESNVDLGTPVNNVWIYEVIVGQGGVDPGEGGQPSWAILKIVDTEGKPIPGIQVNVSKGFENTVKTGFAETDKSGKAWFERTGAIELEFIYPATGLGKPYAQRIEYFENPTTVTITVKSEVQVDKELEDRLRREEEERKRIEEEQRKHRERLRREDEERKRIAEEQRKERERLEREKDKPPVKPPPVDDDKKYNWIIVVLLLIMFTLIFRGLAKQGDE